MKILVTGAFGNIGTMLLDTLIKRGHQVTAFDLKNPVNEKVQNRYSNSVETAWGDICDKESIRPYIKGQDAIVHFAAIIPPMTEKNPELAQKVNVGGTRNILDVISEEEGNPVLIYTSSFAVYGHQLETPPPRTVDCPREATDNYSQHKIDCEDLVKAHKKPWSILRLGASFDTRNRHTDKKMIRMMLDTDARTRIEFIHPADVATAAANACERKEAHNKLHLIGGGASCQITQYEMLNTLLGAAGINVKESEFGSNPFYADWMDTEESQRILEFQNHSFDDLRQELADQLKFIAPFIKPFSRITSWGFVKWARSGSVE